MHYQFSDASASAKFERRGLARVMLDNAGASDGTIVCRARCPSILHPSRVIASTSCSAFLPAVVALSRTNGAEIRSEKEINNREHGIEGRFVAARTVRINLG